jgi:hypothetical protein
MLWLSLRLALQGGREALVRFIVTAIAVTIGVVMLLFVAAEFHGFQAASNRPCWECTTKTQQNPEASAHGLLWLYRKDSFRGQNIKRLDIAVLGTQAPMLPGISRLPQNGEFYASPALSKLLKTAPAGELSDRFPGVQVGIIGNEALASPDALVAYVGRTQTVLMNTPKVFKVNAISTAPKKQASTSFTRIVFAIGGAGLLFPILVLIATATRLSAARREERYAALRLIGATPRQINLIASVDAIVGAICGTVMGIGVFLALRSLSLNLALTGNRFFSHDVTPTVLGYLGMLVGVPMAAAAATLWSLHRVRISPLGVSRKTTPTAPKVWQVIPLLLGIVLFIGVTALTESRDPTAPIAIPGFVLIMVGLITGGPWLTMQAARLMSRLARHAPTLLAARRLGDNPQAAFRSVSGLALAVFMGTVIAGLAPAILAGQHATQTDALSNVLTVAFFNSGDPECSDSCPVTVNPSDGLSPKAGAKLIAQLESHAGVTVYPVYASPVAPPTNDRISRGSGGGNTPNEPEVPNFEIMTCGSLKQLALLGQCPSGAAAIKVAADSVILDRSIKDVTQGRNDVVTASLAESPMRSMFVRVDDTASLERVRTLLAMNALSISGDVPRTFDEVRKDTLETAVTVQRAVFIAMTITLAVAGSSLAVAVGGGLVERKRPFTLLRLSGVPLGALYKVVLWESVVPLMMVTVVAIGIGFGLSALMITAFAPSGTPTVLPSQAYWIAVAVGLTTSLLIVCSTLPLIGRITKPDNARFE